uniref:WD-40 repeat-containing protein n=1 Tax=Candidatus Kentrum sp. TUN TaxID=2126343 RepID=A0A451AAL8_9GAMM|nr:MAG: WD-40 repeat-containing protein [Candidatus Kentron sp. TUN]
MATFTLENPWHPLQGGAPGFPNRWNALAWFMRRLLGFALVSMLGFLALTPTACAADAEASAPELVIDSGGHKAMINDVMFTPDGKQLISVSDDKTIRIWDVEHGELLRTLRGQMGEGHEGKLFAGALSPDGNLLAVGGYLPGNYESRHTIRLMDLHAPQDAPLRLFKGHRNVVSSLAFSPDGKYLLSGSFDHTARLWEIQTGETLRVLAGHTDAIYAVGVSAPGENGEIRLVTGSDDHTLRLWDGAGNLIQVLEGHGDDVMSVAFTPDGRWFLSGSDDKTIRLWDARDGQFIKVLAEQNRGVGSLSVSSDGSTVLSSASIGSGARNNNVFSLPAGERLVQFKKHTNVVLATAISPPDDTGRHLAATGGGDDKEIYLWDLETGQVRHKLVGKGNPIWSVGFARDGGSVAWGKIARIDQNPFIFTTLQHQFQLRQGSRPRDESDWGWDPAWAGAVGDGVDDYLRAIQQVGDIRIRTANNQIHPTLEILEGDTVRHTITRGPTDGYRHRSLTLTPDGQTVISGAGNGVISSYNVASGEQVNGFTGHTGDVWAVAPSPDGRFLVSGSADQTVRLWEIASGKLLLTIFPAADSEWVAWTPAGYYTASLNGDQLIGWQMNQGEDRLALYYPAERFAEKFRKPRVVAHYLATGDLARAITLANREAPDEAPVTETHARDLLAIAPPMVFIRQPNELQRTTDQPHLTIMAEAVSVNQEPILELWVTLNGRVPDGGRTKEPQAHRASLQLQLPLDPGENRIAVHARNRHTKSEPAMRFVDSTILPRPRGKSNLYVLAIGVSDYAKENGKLDLQYADDDARAIARILKAQQGGLYARVETHLLTDRAADRGGVLKGLKWLRRVSTQHDTSVIFLAGHGMKDEYNEYFFLPHDADPEDLEINGIKWLAFQNTLERLPGIRWLLADTCHSGGISGADGQGRGVERVRASSDITEALHDLKAAAGGVVIMSASTGEEQSLEDDAWKHGDSEGHGAFTKALIEGLEEARANQSPPDDRIDIHELNSYVTRRVKELSHGRQHPMTEIPRMLPNFPVGVVD